MDPLSRLFGSAARLKLLRLFLFNEETGFSADDAARRSKVSKETVRKELPILSAAGVVRKRSGKGPVVYQADKRFPHYNALVTFLRTSAKLDDSNVLSGLKKAGTLRLVALSGLFTGVPESKVDILVVGDRLSEGSLAKTVHALEAELGRELRYASFATEDFKYRVGVYDRLVRDVFDYPHRLLFDKLSPP